MGVTSSIPLASPTPSNSWEYTPDRYSVDSSHSRSDQQSGVSECGVSFEKCKAVRSLTGDSLDPNLLIRSGFLPSIPPLCRLSGPGSVWEDALDEAKGLELGHGETNEITGRWRRMIREDLPTVSIDFLGHDIRSLRRAHLVLAFLMHFYVHSDKFIDESTPNKLAMIPKGIAVPLWAVSQRLKLPPVLSYADTVLYNWRLSRLADGFTPENIIIENTFTGTESEAHFYKTSVLVEVLGPTCLSLMKLTIDEGIIADSLSATRITATLLVLSTMIDRLAKVVEKVRDHCDPAQFYWRIRPWFHGGLREMEGVVDSKDMSRWLVTDFGGPSAGQSTLIHALDVFLGIDHRPHPHSSTSSLATSSNPMKQNLHGAEAFTGEETFMARMATYMPYHHRQFLSELADSQAQSSKVTNFPTLPNVAIHSVRSLALASPMTSDLRASYNECVKALGRLRSTHSKTALLYIITQSRLPPPEGSAFIDSWEHKMKVEAERNLQGNGITHLGTGGTDLAKFLKRCKERTSNALID